jgi:glycosyltransferase involved in cell wall biosynthesis
MRVALVTHYFPAHRGGIELVAGELARRLASQHGMEVLWHSSDCDSAPTLPGVRCVPARAWNGVEHRTGTPYPVWSPAALRAAARDARSTDALHIHDCLYLPNFVAYAAARLAGTPVLVTQHVGMVPYGNPVLRALLFAAYRILGRVVLGGASQVLFVSDTTRRYFEPFIAFRSPPRLVANGLDCAVFHPIAAARRAVLRRELGVGADEPLLLFVGRFVEKKGLPMLKHLAGRLTHARWVIAGWGPLDPERWKLPNVCVRRGLSGADLAALYQAADLLVLPSKGEGFPLVVQEAMACGTPALIGADTAAGCPAASALILAEDTGGADAFPRWEQRLRLLLATPEALQALRPAVAAFAAAEWSWERCAETYAGILRRLAGR